VADTWALLIQCELLLQSPAAADELGPGVEQALPLVVGAEARVREIWIWAFSEDPSKIRARILEWAMQHPVRSAVVPRESLGTYLITLVPGGETSTLAAELGGAAEDLNGVVARMDLLPLVLPKLGAWQAQLSYIDFINPRLDQAMALAQPTVKQLDRVVNWLGPEGLDTFADRQRQAVGAMIDQRVEAGMGFLEAERQRFEAWAAQERAALGEALRRERVEATEDVRRTSERLAADATRRAEAFIDYVVLRLAVLVGATLIGVVLVVWVLRWLGPRHGAGPNRPSA
jgi:hypothetical protein